MFDLATSTAEVLATCDVGVTIACQGTTVSLQAHSWSPALWPPISTSPAHSVSPLLHPVEAISPTFVGLGDVILFVELSALIYTCTGEVFLVHDHHYSLGFDPAPSLPPFWFWQVWSLTQPALINIVSSSWFMIFGLSSPPWSSWFISLISLVSVVTESSSFLLFLWSSWLTPTGQYRSRHPLTFSGDMRWQTDGQKAEVPGRWFMPQDWLRHSRYSFPTDLPHAAAHSLEGLDATSSTFFSIPAAYFSEPCGNAEAQCCSRQRRSRSTGTRVR